MTCDNSPLLICRVRCEAGSPVPATPRRTALRSPATLPSGGHRLGPAREAPQGIPRLIASLFALTRHLSAYKQPGGPDCRPARPVRSNRTPGDGVHQHQLRLTSPVPLPTRRPVAPCPRGPASTRPRPLPPPTWGATFASPARQSGTDEVSLMDHGSPSADWTDVWKLPWTRPVPSPKETD